MDQSRQSGLTKLQSLLLKLMLYNMVSVRINTLAVKKLLEVIQVESKKQGHATAASKIRCTGSRKVESC